MRTNTPRRPVHPGRPMMTCHRGDPCKGLCKGLAKAGARVAAQISAALQGLQHFCAILPHVYARACARAHMRWITRNPCNLCNPCTSEPEVPEIRHSPPDDGARVAQGSGANPQGFGIYGPSAAVTDSSQTVGPRCLYPAAEPRACADRASPPPFGSFPGSNAIRGAKAQAPRASDIFPGLGLWFSLVVVVL